MNPEQQNFRLEVCTSLLSKKRNFNWIDNLITGDEKWVMYVNFAPMGQWLLPGQRPVAAPKPDLHPKKEMLSVWWGVHGIAYWELLPTNTTVTAEVYCAQLKRLRDKLLADRPNMREVYFLHDNARPHVAIKTREKLLEFEWEVLPHPPYSPDLAPTDYYLFRSLSNQLREKKFEDRDDLKTFLTNFFDSKPAQFYRNGIHSLPERWRWVVLNNGQ
jgi:histone-lysine N-methyltransferase SETMAR